MNKQELKKELIKFFKHFLKTSIRHYDENNLSESVVNYYLNTIKETEKQECNKDRLTAMTCNYCGCFITNRESEKGLICNTCFIRKKHIK